MLPWATCCLACLRDELVLHTRRHGPRWDALVLDAGSTGHALEFLRMPRIAAQTFRSGRVHQQARQIGAWLEDPKRVSVHVVALPEEMPIREAAELVERLTELGLRVGELIVNGCRDVPPPDVEGVLSEIDAKAAAQLAQASLASAVGELARRELGWQRVQARAIARLEQWTERTAVRLPLLTESASGHALAPLSVALGRIVR